MENHQLRQLNKFLEERMGQLERERGQTLYQQSLMMQHGGMMGMPGPLCMQESVCVCVCACARACAHVRVFKYESEVPIRHVVTYLPLLRYDRMLAFGSDATCMPSALLTSYSQACPDLPPCLPPSPQPRTPPPQAPAPPKSLLQPQVSVCVCQLL